MLFRSKYAVFWRIKCKLCQRIKIRTSYLIRYFRQKLGIECTMISILWRAVIKLGSSFKMMRLIKRISWSKRWKIVWIRLGILCMSLIRFMKGLPMGIFLSRSQRRYSEWRLRLWCSRCTSLRIRKLEAKLTLILIIRTSELSRYLLLRYGSHWMMLQLRMEECGEYRSRIRNRLHILWKGQQKGKNQNKERAQF